jgi:hypothetical protein
MVFQNEQNREVARFKRDISALKERNMYIKLWIMNEIWLHSNVMFRLHWQLSPTRGAFTPISVARIWLGRGNSKLVNSVDSLLMKFGEFFPHTLNERSWFIWNARKFHLNVGHSIDQLIPFWSFLFIKVTFGGGEPLHFSRPLCLRDCFTPRLLITNNS